jgi:cytoskeletal protein CcmA (bactofilin family)
MTDVHIEGVEEEDIDTIVAGDVLFSGSIKFKKPLLIKGRVSGEISTESDLFIGEGAEVRASIKASVVVIRGTFSGSITTSSRVVLFASARVEGSIVSPELVMESGAIFNGRVQMGRAMGA